MCKHHMVLFRYCGHVDFVQAAVCNWARDAHLGTPAEEDRAEKNCFLYTTVVPAQVEDGCGRCKRSSVALIGTFKTRKLFECTYTDDKAREMQREVCNRTGSDWLNDWMKEGYKDDLILLKVMSSHMGIANWEDVMARFPSWQRSFRALYGGTISGAGPKPTSTAEGRIPRPESLSRKNVPVQARRHDSCGEKGRPETAARQGTTSLPGQFARPKRPGAGRRVHFSQAPEGTEPDRGQAINEVPY
ncbi:hypothetical protein NKR23_g11571 [Pleurostoma richardsiae]|uniref:Uncharacterized protein n=1 Tax=Pleurostoma richardsiae TaxID=41990 RepID=A0AA38RBL9_9PEZI|nr:hypothetical protein NKR23_g11571 [Pleurostoma richardsiae]